MEIRHGGEDEREQVRTGPCTKVPRDMVYACTCLSVYLFLAMTGHVKYYF